MQPWLVPHFSVEASNWKQNRTIKAVASNNYRNMQRTEQHEGLAVSFALENKGTATAEDAYIEYQGTNLFYNAIPIGTRSNHEWLETSTKGLLRSERPIHSGRLVSLGGPHKVSLRNTTQGKDTGRVESEIRGTIKVYARNVRARTYSFSMTCQAVLDLLKEKESITMVFDELDD